MKIRTKKTPKIDTFYTVQNRTQFSQYSNKALLNNVSSDSPFSTLLSNASKKFTKESKTRSQSRTQKPDKHLRCAKIELK